MEQQHNRCILQETTHVLAAKLYLRYFIKRKKTKNAEWRTDWDRYDQMGGEKYFFWGGNLMPEADMLIAISRSIMTRAYTFYRFSIIRNRHE